MFALCVGRNLRVTIASSTTGGQRCAGMSRSELCLWQACSPAATSRVLPRRAPKPDSATSAGRQLADKEATPSVDVELVLAVDVSYSMDMDELAIQREGYAQAIVSKEFLQALKTGPNGKIAVTYFEWAASSDQKIIIPWRVIDGPETADAVANEIMKTPIRRASRTSISGAINFAMPLFDENPLSRACGASSTFPATAPTTTARRSSPRATRRWRRASSSTACRSW